MVIEILFESFLFGAVWTDTDLRQCKIRIKNETT